MEFKEAQKRMLERYGVEPESRFIEVPSIAGKAHVLVMGEGPAVVMVNGIGTPAAMWAPLMGKLSGFTIYGLDLPGFGLTDSSDRLNADYRRTAVAFLEDALDGLGLTRPGFVSNSMGSLWISWLALDRPQRVAAMTHVGCPALIEGSSAPLPMRMLSVPLLARIMMTLQPPSPKQVEQLAKMVHQHPLVPELADLLLATEKLAAFERTFLPTLHTLLRLRGNTPEMTLSADQLARIDQRVQLIWGTDDPFGSPAVGERVASMLPNAEFHLVDGGHAPWLNESDRIGPIVTPFLRSHICS